MKKLSFEEGRYRTTPVSPGFLSRQFPSLGLYGRFLRIVWRSAREAQRGRYDFDTWIDSSVDVLRAVEAVGADVEAEGVEHLQGLDGPCVIVGNHMSMLETVVLPSFVGSVRRLTFILKDSLLRTPVFHHIIEAIDAIGVTRTNPRADLKTVLEEGTDRLQKGICVVVFPQTTRSKEFDASQFSSIGVKLAKRAKVPVVPLALLSDAWANGKWVKDFGSIDPSRPVRFAFGAPIPVEGRGSEEHGLVVEFIEQRLAAWSQDEVPESAE